MTERRSILKAAALLLAAACLITGCSRTNHGGTVPEQTAPAAAEMPVKAMPTGMSGVQVETVDIPLYFRMQGEDLLARETRTIYLSRDERIEKAIVRGMIDGPSASLLDLSGTFNPDTQVLGTFETGSVLNVTLSRAFLSAPSDVPEDWYNYAHWREEVLMRRRLSLAAATLAITDVTKYTAVQFLVQERSDDVTGKRILRKEIFFEETDDLAILGPMGREEELLLTQHNSAQEMLLSLQSKNYERLYRFVAQADGERPTQAAFVQSVSAIPLSLIDFSCAPGSVSEDGKSAVVTVQLTFQSAQGLFEVQDYPLQLTRENGMWKISYAALSRMMEADG